MAVIAFLPVITTLIDKLLPDPGKAAEAKLKLIELEQRGELAQITGQLDINRQEAASSSVFVAGWRPFIGWVCGAALAYQYLVRPIVMWVCIANGIVIPELPGLDENLWELLLGMLGLGGLRTFEKVKGVAR